MYFGWFFALCFLLPLLYVLAAGRAAGWTPAAIGLSVGNWRLGLLLSAIAAPLAVLAGFSGSGDAAMQAFYPLSREAAASGGRRLAAYEVAYVCLYYTAWELAFRGIMLFGVLALVPPGPSAVAAALIVQTMVSTVFHLGHPPTEVVAALPTGLVFGAIALLTGSIFYVVFIHAAVGVSSDLFNRRRAVPAGDDRGRAPRAAPRG